VLNAGDRRAITASLTPVARERLEEAEITQRRMLAETLQF
jgi:DNA-binding MarR family transcriptional regulator